MPIYEYQCPACGQMQELLMIPGEKAPEGPPCKACGHQSTFRVLSPHSVAKQELVHGAHTCCGREERCASPPCSSERTCVRG